MEALSNTQIVVFVICLSNLSNQRYRVLCDTFSILAISGIFIPCESNKNALALLLCHLFLLGT